jgi:hypothetical protein
MRMGLEFMAARYYKALAYTLMTEISDGIGCFSPEPPFLHRMKFGSLD